jgi:sarcosine oxidase subunit alpha
VLGGFQSIYCDLQRCVYKAGDQKPNALVQIGAEPMMRATLVELEDGLEAVPLAGKGRLVAGPARRLDASHAHCDVLVVGGGRSGSPRQRPPTGG